MPSSLVLILTILSLLPAFLLAQEEKDHMELQTHTLSRPFIDDQLRNRWFDFGGDAIVNTESHIRLTSNRQEQSGYVWSRLPLVSTDFEIEMEFKVDGSQTHLYGDGLAMWLTKERPTSGEVFGAANHFNGLGIFFDTYDNERSHRKTFPYISAMLNDGTRFYDNSKDGSTTESAGCEADFRAKPFPTKARLTYYKDNYLQLEVQWRTEDVWDECFKLVNVKLPSTVYLGVTAHTGEVTDNHDVIDIATKFLKPKPKVKTEAPLARPKAKSGGFFSFLLKAVAAAGLLGVLFLAYRMYEKNNQMNRF